LTACQRSGKLTPYPFSIGRSVPMAPAFQFCRASQRSWKMLLLAIAALGCAAPVAAQAPPFISFEAKDAGKGRSQGTVATCINQNGTVAKITAATPDATYCCA